jgi:hypothetical protein
VVRAPPPAVAAGAGTVSRGFAQAGVVPVSPLPGKAVPDDVGKRSGTEDGKGVVACGVGIGSVPWAITLCGGKDSVEVGNVVVPTGLRPALARSRAPSGRYGE